MSTQQITQTPDVIPAKAITSDSENIRTIVQSAPESFNNNAISRDKCLNACGQLLDAIMREGMNDAYDHQAAKFIDKTKKTLKAMNERRTPVTKLFDQIRSEFTSMENSIDPSKKDTIPWKLQQLRNQYAAKKRDEEMRRQQEEAARQAALLARNTYRDECVDDYKAKFNNLIVTKINELTDLNNRVTLDSYKAVYDTLCGFCDELPADWCPPSGARLSPALAPDESRKIRSEVFQSLMPQFREQYHMEIGDYRQDLLDKLPSKKTELERAAKASAEEKARIEAEMKAREAADLARKEAERIAREQEEARKKEAEKAAKTSENLFDLPVAQAQSYAPKTKVSKKIVLTAPDGIMQVFSMWWAKEGSGLSLDELTKIFKKQIAFCEKVANKDGEFIQSPSVQYIDDVKAQ